MILIKVTYTSTQPVIKVTYDVTEVTIGGGDVSPIYINLDYSASGAATNLTSVGLTMPTGFSVANSPLTQSGTLAVTYASGYSLPSDAEQATWDTAYNRSLTAASVSGTTTKTLTLTKQDGSTLQASWNDYDTAPVTSVFGRTGAVVATEGDYNLGQLGDVTITSPTTNQVLKYNGSAWVNGTDTDTGLTSVGISVPTGLQVSNSPLTSNGTIAISYGSGYSIPTDAKQTQWDSAYNDKINSAAVTGTSTKTLTLTQQDGGTIQASWSDIDTGLTSVGLTMPSAFTVSNSPLTSNGTIGVTGAGTVSQYVRGDGSLANFPTVPGGGGGGRIFYFNGNTSQGTIVGLPMYQLGVTASTCAAANFTASATGVLANFITDAGVPNLTQIPAGVWTIDAYLSETGGGSNHAELYAKLEIYNGSTVTLVGTSPVLQIVEGSFATYYSFDISVPTTTISASDRIVIQFYIQNTNGKSVTLYTEDGKIAEVHTTFTTGIGTLNGLTAGTQYFAVGTSGTDFSINSVTDTHTFNLPTASATARGALSSSDWSVFNTKIGVNDTIDCGTW